MGGDFAEEGAEGGADWSHRLLVRIEGWSVWVISYWVPISF
jgi:hypothetical protein